MYAECASLFDLRDSHRLEALARLGTGVRVEQLRDLFQFVGDGLIVKEGWKADIEALLRTDPGPRSRAEVASAIQRRIGELLIELATDVQNTLNVDALCLSGGLFYNTYFNTLLQSSGLFARTFVPVNPGNAGLAVGGPLLVSASETGLRRGCVSPLDAARRRSGAGIGRGSFGS